MRVFPLIFYLAGEDDFKEKHRIISQVSGITHSHPRSILACFMYVEFGTALLKGADLIEAYKNMQKSTKEFYTFEPYHSELEHFSLLVESDITKLMEENISSSGYVVDTLEASIWCLLTKTGYEETILAAVNLGEDTDTTAAVAGGLAGIYYGLNSIPKEVINTLARSIDIRKLAEDFAALCNNP